MTPNLGVVLVRGNSKAMPLPFRPLEELEYQKFTTASTELFKFAKRQELFRLVHTNYMEYKNGLNEYFKIYCEKFDVDGSYLEGMIFDINRLALNFLSAVRTFVDHSETYIKRTYGKKSKEAQNFEKTTNSYFDKCFSYRFLSKLRNYSQHVGMPITGLHTSSEMVNLDPVEYDHVFKTVTLKDDLLKFDDFNWGKYTELDELGNPKLDELGNPNKLEIKDEISLLPKKIDIDPYIDEIIYCIKLIDLTLFGKNEFIKLLEYKAFLDNFIKEASEFIKLLQDTVFLENLAKESSEYIKLLPSMASLDKLVKEASDIIPGVFVQVQDINNTGKLKSEIPELLQVNIDRIPLNAMKLIDLLNIQPKGNPSE